MTEYVRDIDIGKPRTETYDVNVKVDEAIETALEPVVSKLEEAISNLEKTHRATELILGQEVEEA
jgi:hypothetical protein